MVLFVIRTVVEILKCNIQINVLKEYLLFLLMSCLFLRIVPHHAENGIFYFYFGHFW